MARLLAADLGATKSLLCLFEQVGDRRRVLRETELGSRQHPDAASIVQAFLGGERVEAAVIAIAGPVVGGRSETPNLPWVVEQTDLARVLGTDQVELLNDLAATAYGVTALAPEALSVINRGTAAPGTIAVIAAGTGLGEAILARTDSDYIALPSEGGHADFAPGNDTEIELLRYLAAQFGHVSWERVVSGPGLQSIYQFLLDTGRGRPSEELALDMARRDPPAAIAEAALSGRDPTASLALDLFVGAYGAEAGNLALKVLALGGVYVAGGIAPKIAPRLRSGVFLRRFTEKGRHSGLLGQIPVYLVGDARTALNGAALRAARLARA